MARSNEPEYATPVGQAHPEANAFIAGAMWANQRAGLEISPGCRGALRAYRQALIDAALAYADEE